MDESQKHYAKSKKSQTQVTTYGTSLVKRMPAKPGDMGSIPGPGRFLMSRSNYSPCATTTEPVCCNHWGSHAYSLCSAKREPLKWAARALQRESRLSEQPVLCNGQRARSLQLEKVKVKSLSRVRLFATPWTVAYQAPQSMEFSRQEYWRGLPFPSPGDLPNPGIEARSPSLQADALPSESPGKALEKTHTKWQRSSTANLSNLFKKIKKEVHSEWFNLCDIIEKEKTRKKSDQWLLIAGGEGREFTIKDYEELSFILILVEVTWLHTSFPGGSVVKNLPAMQET